MNNKSKTPTRTTNQKTQIRKPRRRTPTNLDLPNLGATTKVLGGNGDEAPSEGFSSLGLWFDEFSLFDDVFLL